MGDPERIFLPTLDTTRLVIYSSDWPRMAEVRLGVVLVDDIEQVYDAECHRCGQHTTAKTLSKAVEWLEAHPNEHEIERTPDADNR